MLGFADRGDSVTIFFLVGDRPGDNLEEENIEEYDIEPFMTVLSTKPTFSMAVTKTYDRSSGFVFTTIYGSIQDCLVRVANASPASSTNLVIGNFKKHLLVFASDKHGTSSVGDSFQLCNECMDNDDTCCERYEGISR